MSLRFFSDQCVPAEITDTLRQHGHQVTLLREVLPIRSLDPAVITKAQELGAVLVSLNGDFADIVAYPPANYFTFFCSNNSCFERSTSFFPSGEITVSQLIKQPGNDPEYGNEAEQEETELTGR